MDMPSSRSSARTPDCAGPGALAFTRTRTEGKKVKLHSEPGTNTDEKGNLWRYVEVAERSGIFAPPSPNGLEKNHSSAGCAVPSQVGTLHSALSPEQISRTCKGKENRMRRAVLLPVVAAAVLATVLAGWH